MKAAGSLHRLATIQDANQIDNLYLDELRLGREKLALGDLNRASEHLANAIVVAPQPDQLLATIQGSVGPDEFRKLKDQLPAAQRRLQAALSLNSSTI